jgi:hypothetical protein
LDYYGTGSAVQSVVIEHNYGRSARKEGDSNHETMRQGASQATRWTIGKGEWHFKAQWFRCIDPDQQLYIDDEEDDVLVGSLVVHHMSLVMARTVTTTAAAPRERNIGRRKKQAAELATLECLQLVEKDRMMIINTGLDHFSTIGM